MSTMSLEFREIDQWYDQLVVPPANANDMAWDFCQHFSIAIENLSATVRDELFVFFEGRNLAVRVIAGERITSFPTRIPVHFDWAQLLVLFPNLMRFFSNHGFYYDSFAREFVFEALQPRSLCNIQVESADSDDFSATITIYHDLDLFVEHGFHNIQPEHINGHDFPGIFMEVNSHNNCNSSVIEFLATTRLMVRTGPAEFVAQTMFAIERALGRVGVVFRDTNMWNEMLNSTEIELVTPWRRAKRAAI